MSALTLFGVPPAYAGTLYNVIFQYETEGGKGYSAKYMALSPSQIAFSDIGLAKGGTFASIKLPAKGGSGCKKGFEIEANPSKNILHSISSLCATIDREDSDVYYVKSELTMKFDDSSQVNNYVAFHLYTKENGCNVTLDAAWRSFRDGPGRQFQATKLLSSICQIPGPGFFQVQ